MNQPELKIGVIGQCGDGATFQNKAETAQFSRLRQRQRAILDQGGGGGGATFLIFISIAALTFVDSQIDPILSAIETRIMKLMELAHRFS